MGTQLRSEDISNQETSDPQKKQNSRTRLDHVREEKEGMKAALVGLFSEHCEDHEMLGRFEKLLNDLVGLEKMLQKLGEEKAIVERNGERWGKTDNNNNNNNSNNDNNKNRSTDGGTK